MNNWNRGALAIAAIALAAGDVRAEDKVDPGSTEYAISEAIGVVCVPVLIIGKLASDDLIREARFTSGTQAHPEKLSTPSFERRLEHGDIVEVFTNLKDRSCTVHVHGAATAIDAYRAALTRQNWQQFMPTRPSRHDTTIEGWRVGFPAPAGSAFQVVVAAPPGTTDPAKPQVIANISHMR